MNLIKQILRPGEYGTQTIKMIVKSNERGAQGEQGEKGEAATITAGQAYAVEEGQQAVINTGTSSNAVFDFYLPKGPKGDDGAIKYTAGTGIKITDGNVIEATGDATAAWGGIQGDIADQTDLQNELANFAEIGTTLSTPTDVAYVSNNNIQSGAVTTPKIADGAVTKDKIDWSSIKFKAGDTYSIVQTMTGQVRNLSNVNQNDMNYFTVILPFEVADNVSVALNTFSIDEIENIGAVSGTNVVLVLDDDNNSVSRTQAHMTANVSISSSSRRSLILTFGLKSGYHWSGATSYNAVQFRTTSMTFTFSAAS